MIEDTRCECGKLPYRHEMKWHVVGGWSSRTHSEEVAKIYKEGKKLADLKVCIKYTNKKGIKL